MKFEQLTTPVQIVERWPLLREGFIWLKQNTKQDFNEETTLRRLCFLSSQPEKSYMALAYENDVLHSFLIAFDATPIFDEERVFSLYALMHKPSQIRLTRKLINMFELWAVSKDIRQYSLATRKYGKSSINLFSRLGFKRDNLILTKEI